MAYPLCYQNFVLVCNEMRCLTLHSELMRYNLQSKLYKLLCAKLCWLHRYQSQKRSFCDWYLCTIQRSCCTASYQNFVLVKAVHKAVQSITQSLHNELLATGNAQLCCASRSFGVTLFLHYFVMQSKATHKEALVSKKYAPSTWFGLAVVTQRV